MFDSLHRIDGQGLHVVEYPPEAGLADPAAYNSPSKAPLAEDCRACAVLAALCFQDGSRVAVSIQSKNAVRKALARLFAGCRGPNGFSSIKLQSFDAAGAHFWQAGYEIVRGGDSPQLPVRAR
jgi:hypothetical protein